MKAAALLTTSWKLVQSLNVFSSSAEEVFGTSRASFREVGNPPGIGRQFRSRAESRLKDRSVVSICCQMREYILSCRSFFGMYWIDDESLKA